MSSKYQHEFKNRDFSRFQEQAGATPDKHLLYVYGQYLRQLQRTEERVAKRRGLTRNRLYIEHETELIIPTIKKQISIIEGVLDSRGLAYSKD